MLRLARRNQIARSCVFGLCLRFESRCNSTVASRHHDPLRILFCGADAFSIASLRALNRLRVEAPEKIATIDVLCRPDKRTGRGRKQITEVPIKRVALELGLDLHQVDNFKSGWQPPAGTNMVIAVSFGLLIPRNILEGAKYGGLNVHPSLLPDLYGPAPIIQTLLKARTRTGVTLQTLHPTKFDQGQILAQTAAPGIPVPSECTLDELLEEVKIAGADMLCKGIEDGLFVPPVKPMSLDSGSSAVVEHAPKIESEDRHIDWETWTADTIIRRGRVLDKLWDMQTHRLCYGRQKSESLLRTTFEGNWNLAPTGILEGRSRLEPGEPLLIPGKDSKGFHFGIATTDGHIVLPTAATLQGERKSKGLNTLSQKLPAPSS